mgnify:CR=1 FL=1
MPDPNGTGIKPFEWEKSKDYWKKQLEQFQLQISQFEVIHEYNYKGGIGLRSGYPWAYFKGWFAERLTRFLAGKGRLPLAPVFKNTK